MAIASTGLSVGNTATLSPLRNDRIEAALRRPVERLAQEAESTRVRLSAFGQVQSATAAVQATARNLQETRQTANVADARRSLETFVDAFNRQKAALAGAAGTPVGGQTNAGPVAPAESGRARIATGQLERLLADNAVALRDAGVRVQQDGSLAVDAKALESAFATNPAAVTRAIGDVGRAAEATTTRQLSNSGSVGAAVNNLNNRLQQIETRETEVRARTEEVQRAVESTAHRYGFGAVGAGAYLGIFGL